MLASCIEVEATEPLARLDRKGTGLCRMYQDVSPKQKWIQTFLQHTDSMPHDSVTKAQIFEALLDNNPFLVSKQRRSRLVWPACAVSSHVLAEARKVLPRCERWTDGFQGVKTAHSLG